MCDKESIKKCEISSLPRALFSQ